MDQHFMFNSNHSVNSHKPESIVTSNHQTQSIQQAQESIYCFLGDIVKEWHPKAVLQEFNRLFIQHIDSVNPEAIQAIYKIGLNNNEEEFICTIKRSCYLLINNWKTDVTTKKYIQELIELFANPIIRQHSLSPTINNLRSWTQNFVNSKDYQELKLFASNKHQKQCDWRNRYTSYLS